MTESSRRPVLIVLDDDPTGAQTVCGVEVFMEWAYASLIGAYRNLSGFFILTNSRALAERETVRLHREIADVLCRCAKETGRKFLLCSRSDSTLRGHFPAETDALAETMAGYGIITDKVLLCPCFVEGGRVTIDGVHYVGAKDGRVPAAWTEFAKDPYFGYKSSDLVEYVQEKTRGAVDRNKVVKLTLDAIRSGKSAEILKRPADVVVCDGESDSDMGLFASAVWDCAEAGQNFIVRCAASIVRALFGQGKAELLDSERLINAKGVGGLIIAGSYTGKTTGQLNRLRECEVVFTTGQLNRLRECEVVFTTGQLNRLRECGAVWAELDVNAELGAQINDCASRCEEAVNCGKLAVLYTSRAARRFENGEEALEYSRKISVALCEIVGKLDINPRFLIAKGGATSYDIGVKTLGTRRAEAIGQALEGAPVWNATGKFAHTPYIIFPGNVGDENSLLQLVNKLV